MAVTPRVAGTHLCIELGGQAAGPLRSLQPPSYRVDRIDGSPRGGTVVRAASAVTLGEMAADFSPDQPSPLRDWALRFAGADWAPQSGAAQVLDHNFALRRSLAFDGGELTQLRLPALSATDGRAPVLWGLAWRVQALRDSVGDGRIVPALKGRAKAMLAGNFRVTGLPFDGAAITRVGLPLLRRVDVVANPSRLPLRAGALDPGELSLGVGGRAHDKARAWVQQVVADRNVGDAERLDITVDLLDNTLKTVLATVQLTGCRLLACDEPLIETATDAMATVALRFSVGAVGLSFGKG